MTINLTAQNWLTTLGGFLGGIPTIIIGAAVAGHITLSPLWLFIVSSIGGMGTLLIGLSAKDANTHSTQGQVQLSTMKAGPRQQFVDQTAIAEEQASKKP
jgi:hypothetical protein